MLLIRLRKTSKKRPQTSGAEHAIPYDTLIYNKVHLDLSPFALHQQIPQDIGIYNWAS